MLPFLIFLFGYTLSQFYRSFLAVIAPELARDLGLSAADLGAMSGIWFAAFAFGQFPVGWALDRFGPRRSVPLIMLSGVAGAALLAIAQSRGLAIAAMALIGLGCAPIYMGALFMFGRAYPVERFSLLSSWLLAIGSAGNLIAATPLALAAQHIGWRPAFAAMAVVTLIAAALIAWLIRDPPRQLAASGKSVGFVEGIKSVLSIRALWSVLPLVFVSYAVVIAERALWVGPYLADEHGLGPVDRGNAVLAMAIAMSVGAFALGAADPWLGRRKWLVTVCSLICAAAFLFLAMAGTLSVISATVLLMLIGFFGHTYGVVMAHGRSFLPDHLLGRGITLLNFIFIGGAGLLQFASGRLFETTKTYTSVHLLFSLALVAALVPYALSRERK
jgi:MFS family permease